MKIFHHIKRFFSAKFVTHKLTKFPNDLKKEAIFLTVLGIIISSLFDLLSFFLQFGKDQVAKGNIVLGLVFIGVYYTKSALNTSIDLWLDDLRTNYREHYTTTINNNVASVLLKIRGKVWRNDEETNSREMMSTNTLLTSSKQYISLMWDFKTNLPKNIFQFASLIFMFMGFIFVTNLEIQHTTLFAVIVLFTATCSTIFSYRRIHLRKKHRKDRKKSSEKRDDFLNDVLNIEPVSQNHAKFMASNFIEASKEIFSFDRIDRKSINIVNFFESFINAIATISIIGIKVYETGLKNIDLNCVLSIIALVSIYSQIINRIHSLIRLTETCSNSLEEIKNYENDFSEMMKVLDEEEKELESASSNFGTLKSISVPPFDVQYHAIGSETPFSLKNASKITLYPGDIALLVGPTGSGKTTFIKMVTKIVKFDNFELSYDKEKEGPIRSIVHQTDGKLGCNDVLSEILFDGELDKAKLFEILKGLHLYEEICEKHLTAKNDEEKDEKVIEYLKTSRVRDYSTGQRQRLAITRLLYNIDDSIQVIAFDEATNALNDEITIKTLSFIRKYCPNKILVIATHQVEIGQKIATKTFKFVPSGTHYQIQT